MFTVTEDDIIYWQDVLESVRAGRTDNLKCPFCYEGTITVAQRAQLTRLECTRCRHFLEGRFSDVAE